MPLSDAEKRAVALLRREGAAWRQARWILLVTSLSALVFGLLPWTRLVFDLTALASAPNEVVPYLVLGVARTWLAQGIAAVVGGFGLFVVLRNWRGKPERTLLLGLVERQLGIEVARLSNPEGPGDKESGHGRQVDG